MNFGLNVSSAMKNDGTVRLLINIIIHIALQRYGAVRMGIAGIAQIVGKLYKQG